MRLRRPTSVAQALLPIDGSSAGAASSHSLPTPAPQQGGARNETNACCAPRGSPDARERRPGRQRVRGCEAAHLVGLRSAFGLLGNPPGVRCVRVDSAWAVIPNSEAKRNAD